MLALEPVIVEQLRSGLAVGWKVMGLASDAGRRDGWPLASVSFVDGNVADSKTSAAAVQAAWRVTLIAKRGDQAVALVDAAFAAVMASLHNWAPPGEIGGRRWERLRLLQVTPAQYPEDGLVGVDLTFTTQARYDGQD
ncbi:hypothetical protein [Variovorax atrisoli]|uniref:hypothetical protein n=1 Tax=Variovorax atrisoli TaxID=3394203 RepID=UPI0040400886